jgi:hypothetical protein
MKSWWIFAERGEVNFWKGGIRSNRCWARYFARRAIRVVRRDLLEGTDADSSTTVQVDKAGLISGSSWMLKRLNRDDSRFQALDWTKPERCR